MEQPTKQDIGSIGEQAAVDFLLSNGYAILERNWRTGNLEVDIIALKDNVLAFVEVKSRSENFLVAPQNAVTKTKQRNIISAAGRFVERYGREEEVRFDIISVVLRQGNVVDLEHIESAYYPILR